MRMVIEKKDTQCWINEADKILSFHFVPNFLHLEFEDRDQLMNYVFEHLAGQGYRVQ